ncbi:amidase [Acetobacter orientalis]|uniref:Amidase n=1 Tax=Acetobacter orientalis TaxID=146474 RepID=A0A252BHP0_9PROT|nr:amidase [Acetobacter orientalis]OUJ03943.1 amidase [Acetobacter orientalis]
MPASSTLSLLATARALAQGHTTSLTLVEQALARISAPEGEGARTFTQVHTQAAQEQAAKIDAHRKAGHPLPLLAGIPMSVKDLFDEAGSTTTAGSAVLADSPPAQHDAIAVHNAKQAGLISIGRTSMTEFAFSGVGINPHTGTPANPWQRDQRRIPGGSSSGAAISVTDGMAHIALGSDTGGSCRIPAALTGLVGYKPTASRISTVGTVPLSFTLDSLGSIGHTVACCWATDQALTGTPPLWTDCPTPEQTPAPRLGILQNYATDGLDNTVSQTYQNALRTLEKAGASLHDVTLPELAELPHINRLGGFPAPESLTWHQQLIATKAELYDPFVLKRILRGKEQTAVDYITLIQARQRLIAQATQRLGTYDAIVMPTVPCVAPKIADMSDDTLYTRTNLALLRNPTITNFLDGCAISLPCHPHGTAPVGLMAMQFNNKDAHLFRIATWLEHALGPSRE